MEHVKLYFDPRCAWCYQTSRWLRTLESAGVIELDYGLYCLELANLNEGRDPVDLGRTGRSAPALRVAWAIKQKEDSKAMGRFYRALGERTWEYDPPMRNLAAAVIESAEVAGFDAALVEEATSDPATWLGVLEEHQKFVTDNKAIGVPSIVFEGNEGSSPSIFGPVISLLPDEKTALEMWRHVAWLVRYRNFAELKRKRIHIEGLAATRYPQEERPWGPRPWIEELEEATRSNSAP